MKKLLCEKLLAEIENKLEYLKTPRLRADAALGLLREKQTNHQEIDLRTGTQGLKELLGEIDEVDQSSEIDIAIKILVHYLEINSFSLLAVPRCHADETMAELFNGLNKRLEKIVNKFSIELTQFPS